MNWTALHPRWIWRSVLITLLVGMTSFHITTRFTSGFLAWSDGLAYFLFARSLVLDGNSDITKGYEELERRYPAELNGENSALSSLRVNARRSLETGRIYTVWPVGAGIVMAPFFALGYITDRLVASVLGRAPDSFGIIPQFFVGIGTLVFGLLGFWATFLCCRRKADPKWAAIGSLAVILAGPGAFYIFVNPTMAHAMSFGLVSLLTLLWWQQWDQGSTPGRFAVLSFLLGLLICIRFQNAIFGLLLAALLLAETRKKSCARVALLGFCGGMAALVPLAAQVLHAQLYGPPQKTIALHSGGLLMIGNYPLQLTSPYFLDVLFSCRHGAFHWAPVLAIGVIGLLLAARKERWAWVFLVTIFCHVYLIGSLGISDLGAQSVSFDKGNWDQHWKGGTSFGMRYLTECAPFFAVGLAGLMQATNKWIGLRWWSLALSGLIAWNALLILAYGMDTISRSQCVTYRAMINGVGQAVSKGIHMAADGRKQALSELVFPP